MNISHSADRKCVIIYLNIWNVWIFSFHLSQLESNSDEESLHKDHIKRGSQLYSKNSRPIKYKAPLYYYGDPRESANESEKVNIQ